MSVVSPIGATLFTVLVWAAVGLVLLVFLWVARTVFGERGAEAPRGGVDDAGSTPSR